LCCAFYSAISNGEREFEKIAIIGSGDDFIFPCGNCRQVMIELAPEIEVICAKNEKEFKIIKIQDLMPNSFNSNALKK